MTSRARVRVDAREKERVLFIASMSQDSAATSLISRRHRTRALTCR